MILLNYHHHYQHDHSIVTVWQITHTFLQIMVVIYYNIFSTNEAILPLPKLPYYGTTITIIIFNIIMPSTTIVDNHHF